MLIHIDLANHIQAAFSISTPEVERIIDFFKPMTLSRNDFFLKEKQYAQLLGFVQSGLVREYFDNDGREVTKWISGSGYFVTDLASFLFDKPARVNIQALTDCTLFTVSKTDYARIGQVVPRWPAIEKTFIARWKKVWKAGWWGCLNIK